jgi:uncharacterized membrane protein
MINKDILISAIVMVVIDYFYLSSVSNYFNNLLLKIQNEKIKLDYSAAILCYIFLVFGLYYFVLKNNRPVKDAFFLGLIIYMVYEATNKAIFKNWDWKTVFMDGIWGGILFAITTFLTYKIKNYKLKK